MGIKLSLGASVITQLEDLSEYGAVRALRHQVPTSPVTPPFGPSDASSCTVIDVDIVEKSVLRHAVAVEAMLVMNKTSPVSSRTRAMTWSPA